MAAVPFTRAKAGFSTVYDEVERVGAVVVERRKSQPLALVRRDELAALLAERCPFTTKTSRAADRTISIWLDQLDLYGRGASITEAVDDLLDEVEDYVEEWERSLRTAPNHEARRWYVHRLQLAGDREAIRDVIFALPSD